MGKSFAFNRICLIFHNEYGLFKALKTGSKFLFIFSHLSLLLDFSITVFITFKFVLFQIRGGRFIRPWILFSFNTSPDAFRNCCTLS